MSSGYINNVTIEQNKVYIPNYGSVEIKMKFKNTLMIHGVGLFLLPVFG